MEINTMSIAQASIQLNQAQLQQNVQMSVMKLAMNQQTQSTQLLADMLPTVSVPDPQGRGQVLDIIA